MSLMATGGGATPTSGAKAATRASRTSAARRRYQDWKCLAAVRLRRAGQLEATAPQAQGLTAILATGHVECELAIAGAVRTPAARGWIVDDNQLVLVTQVGEALAGRRSGAAEAGRARRARPASAAPRPACRARPLRARGASTGTARPPPAAPSRGMLMPIVRRRALRRTANVTSSTVRVSRTGVIAVP